MQILVGGDEAAIAHVSCPTRPSALSILRSDTVLAAMADSEVSTMITEPDPRTREWVSSMMR